MLVYAKLLLREREISPRKYPEPSWESIEPEAEVVDM